MKMNIMNKIEKAFRGLMPLLLIAVFAPSLVSCDDDEDYKEIYDRLAITIDGIYLQDVNAEDSIYDREVTFARLGQLIRIQGSGFTGLKNIYINGYDTYFNNALMTDNNVWVTLNADTPVEDAEDDVRNTIRLVKDNTSLTYEFTVRAASPSVTSISTTLPAAGETVVVYGANLQETTRVVLPDGTEITSGITNDEEGEWYSFTMPSGVGNVSGSITSYGANGTAQSPAYFYFGNGGSGTGSNCYIINFDGLGVQGSWSATFSAEDLVDDPLNSGRGKVVQIVPNSVLDEGGVAAGVSNQKGFWTAGNDDASDDWNRMTVDIPGTTPLSSVALQFDVYCPEEWDLTGQIEITIQNNLSNYGYGSGCTTYNADYINQAYAWVPWMDRETGEHTPFTTGERWQTITIPLTEFGNYTNDEIEWTFQNVIDDKNAGSYRNFGVLFCNSDIEFSEEFTYPSSLFNQKIYLDNFRIVPCSTFTVSDY